ncbi:uncharacterized protein [Dendropsophus ebraccatus]|uniref:uncharacterized protein isoform X2 n=1 Tax=Dendropsophus ebraccatus TaxID=150705 RepID=UPI003831A3D4
MFVLTSPINKWKCFDETQRFIKRDSRIFSRHALSMEKQQQQEENGLFAPLAVCLSPILFSEEEDSEYDSLNPEERRENTIVVFRNDRSPVHFVSSEDLISTPTSHICNLGSRSYSPPCSEPEEETELVYISPTPLLEISSSSSSTSIPEKNRSRDNFEVQNARSGAWNTISSDYSSECECCYCDSQSTGEISCNETSPSQWLLRYQVKKDYFIYKYNTFGLEMIQAVRSLRSSQKDGTTISCNLWKTVTTLGRKAGLSLNTI